MPSRLLTDHSRPGALAGDVGIACGSFYSTPSITLLTWRAAAGAAGLVRKLEGIQIAMPRSPGHQLIFSGLRALGIR
eukprot:6309717-Pyramimonas_sp.AAC.1